MSQDANRAANPDKKKKMAFRQSDHIVFDFLVEQHEVLVNDIDL